MVAENTYDHETTWLRRLATMWPCCGCIRRPAYVVKEKTTLFFELRKSEPHEMKSELRSVRNEDEVDK